MGNVKVSKMTHDDPEFYSMIGPYLSRREVVKELGGPIWDDDGKTWYVARKGRRLIGFAGLRLARGKHVLCSAYVLPDERRQGVYTSLLLARLADCAGVATATATAASVPALHSHGFKAAGKRGAFTKMERQP